jgi:hypothetical protein
MPLRFGVIAGEIILPAHVRSIEQLLELGATCELMMVAERSPRMQSESSPQLPAACRRAVRTPLRGAGSLLLGREEAARIRACKLDFVLDCSTASIAGEGVDAPRYGIWSWFYGAGAKDEPCLFELYSGHEHTPVTLERLGSRREVLRSGVINTDPVSYRNTLETAMMAGIDFPAWCAKRLTDSGRLEPEGAGRGRRALGAVRRTIAWIRIAVRWALSQIRLTLVTEMWNVGVVHAPISAFLQPGYEPQITWVPPPPGNRFYADPFIVARDGAFEVLMEEFDYSRNQGYIASIVTCGRKFDAARVLIDEGVHMSYPFPLRYGNDLYCIPESRRSRCVLLYRFASAENAWRRVHTLIDDFAALDSTVIQHQGRWWLFCTCQDDLPECKLYLWHAVDLFGPWQPHRMNPVKCDVRSSRPGGAPFWLDGALYRPTQDSSVSYGGALTINRVGTLTVDHFKEEPVAHIARVPGPYPDGVHTLSGDDNITVLDAKRMRFVPELTFRRLRFKLTRLAGRTAG